MHDSEVDIIDVKRVIADTPLDELNQLAEEYFARLADWNFHLTKPLGSVDEAPQLLINFAVVLQGLKMCPGITVLEFGAGTCWASRFLTQLGCRVIATDVSPTALRIGRELYDRQPVIGDKPEPQFLVFDGRRFDLPDESVDRVICLDALHHVPNIAQVLSEMARVLRQGGMAGFAEPGPEHSCSEKSQSEMRAHGVVENDVDIRQIWADARAAGFTDIKLAVFSVEPHCLSLDEFENFLAGDSSELEKYTHAVREFIKHQRNFFLYKGKPAPVDSRFREHVSARIELRENELSAPAGHTIAVQATVTNDGRAVWLPPDAGVGGVFLGVQVADRERKILHESWRWEPLTPNEGPPIRPGESVTVDISIPPLPAGEYVLKFDMVSYDVCWFSAIGSPQAELLLTVTE